MRIFVGLTLTKEIQENIIFWQEKHADMQHMRFTKQHNLHITILPPQYVNEVTTVMQQLSQSPPLNPFLITFKQLISFPSKNPHYLWATGDAPEALITLRNILAGILEKRIDQKPFTMHTTIGRIGKGENKIHIEEKIQWEMKVDSFTLFASHLSGQGSDYEILKTYDLKFSA